MMLLEHDAKVLLAEGGVPVPRGWLVATEDPGSLPARPPFMVKAQVPVGGRGKIGAIVRAQSPEEIKSALHDLLGRTIKGHLVRECRIEESLAGAECYLSLSLDPARGCLTLLLSEEGGVDIEAKAQQRGLATATVDFNHGAAAAAIRELAAEIPHPISGVLHEAGLRLCSLFFSLEATLLEINPLFVRPDGTWSAGDAKLIVDGNALVRRPRLAALIRERAAAYPEAALKLTSGFDFIVLDPDGDIGLVTTGAGLSMQLVDELAARGHRPFNFCDIRTSQFRGDPGRLIRVLRSMAAAPSVRSVLMNFFAGITHLGELAHVLIAALEATPELRVPMTARLIGNGYEEAVAILRAAGNPVHLERDLDRAVAAAVAPLAGDGR
jgi:succinyl-CoA synthetase beta subunit